MPNWVDEDTLNTVTSEPQVQGGLPSQELTQPRGNWVDEDSLPQPVPPSYPSRPMDITDKGAAMLSSAVSNVSKWAGIHDVAAPLVNEALGLFHAGVGSFAGGLDTLRKYIGKRIPGYSSLSTGLFSEAQLQANKEAEGYLQKAKEQGIGPVGETIASAVGGAVPGVAKFVLFNPLLAGLEEAGKSEEKGESQIGGFVRGAAERALLGKAFSLLGKSGLSRVGKALSTGGLFAGQQMFDSVYDEGKVPEPVDLAKGFGTGVLMGAVGGKKERTELKPGLDINEALSNPKLDPLHRKLAGIVTGSDLAKIKDERDVGGKSFVKEEWKKYIKEKIDNKEPASVDEFKAGLDKEQKDADIIAKEKAQIIKEGLAKEGKLTPKQDRNEFTDSELYKKNEKRYDDLKKQREKQGLNTVQDVTPEETRLHEGISGQFSPLAARKAFFDAIEAGDLENAELIGNRFKLEDKDVAALDVTLKESKAKLEKETNKPVETLPVESLKDRKQYYEDQYSKIENPTLEEELAHRVSIKEIDKAIKESELSKKSEAKTVETKEPGIKTKEAEPVEVKAEIEKPVTQPEKAVVQPEKASIQPEKVGTEVQTEKPIKVERLRAAVKTTTGEIFTGKTHDEIIKRKGLEPDDLTKDSKGFLAPDGKFLNRENAANWVKENQPTAHEKLGDEFKNELHSSEYTRALKDAGIIKGTIRNKIEPITAKQEVVLDEHGIPRKVDYGKSKEVDDGRADVNLKTAQEFLGRDVEPTRGTLEKHGTPREQEVRAVKRRKIESELLKKNAEETETLIPHEPLTDKLEEQTKELRKKGNIGRVGGENEVIHDEKRQLAIKRKFSFSPGQTFRSYLDSIPIFNKLFPETSIRLLGFSEKKDDTGNNILMPVTEQKWIKGKQPTQDQISVSMKERADAIGYDLVISGRNYKLTSKDGKHGIFIEDLSVDNAILKRIKGKDYVFPIDAKIKEFSPNREDISKTKETKTVVKKIEEPSKLEVLRKTIADRETKRNQEELLSRPGPGGKTANAKEPESDLDQLRVSVENQLKNNKTENKDQVLSYADKVNRSVSDFKSSAESIMEGIKGAWGDVKERMKDRKEVSPYLQTLGTHMAEGVKESLKAKRYAEVIVKALPNKLQMEAISNYIEADGDPAHIRDAIKMTTDKYREGWKATLRLTPQEKLHAEQVRQYFNSKLKEAIASGMMKDGVENYVMRIVKPGSQAGRKFKAMVNSGLLQKDPSFIKRRIFETILEGERQGTNYIKNVGLSIVAYANAFSEAKLARNTINELLHSGLAKDGKAYATIIGGVVYKEKLSEAEERFLKTNSDIDRKEAYMVKPRLRSEKAFAENGDPYLIIDHPALRDWKYVGSDADGKAIVLQGDVAIHPEIYKHLKNVLSRSAIRDTEIGRNTLTLAREFKSTLLSMSGFHQVQEGLHAAFHMVKPWDLPKIDLDNPIQYKLVKNGVVVYDHRAAEIFGEGVAATGLIQRAPIVGPMFQKYNTFLFSSWIPRLKMKMALAALERNTKRFKGKMTEDAIYFKTAEQANAAFGELNYKMMGRSQTVQDAFRLMALAPDFLEARIRFVTQALRPGGAEQRWALVRGTLGLGVGAAVINMLLNDGDPHFEKPLTVVFRGKDFTMRSIPGDLIHAFTDGRSFVYHRLNPTITRSMIEMATGRDYLGRKRSFDEQMKDFVMTHVPIPLQALTEKLFDDRDRKLWESALNSVGFATYDSRSLAEGKARKLMLDKGPFSYTEHSKMVNNMLRKLDKETLTHRDIEKSLAKKEITSYDYSKIIKEHAKSNIIRAIEHLDLDGIEQVWNKMTPKEKRQTRSMIRKKLYNRLPKLLKEEKEKLRPFINEINRSY